MYLWSAFSLIYIYVYLLEDAFLAVILRIQWILKSPKIKIKITPSAVAST